MPGSSRRPRRRASGAGVSAAEVLCVLLVLATLTAASALSARSLVRRQAAAAASRSLASELRLRRAQAIATGSAIGLVLAREDTTWRVTLHGDGDQDGVLSGDVASGVDAPLERPQRFSDRYGARLGFLPGLEGLRSPPPGSQPLGSLEDPVRFGAADIVAFHPRGRTSSGTFYLTDGSERQFAVVLYGATGRVRIWEYEPTQRAWRRR